MALFNEILVGRYNRALQKLFGLKGGPPAPQLGSEVTAAWQFFGGVETRYLEGWDRYWFDYDNAANPATFNAFRWRNPANGSTVAVFEKINTLNVAGATNQVGVFINRGGVTDLANISAPAVPFSVDPRGRRNPSLIISNQNTLAAPTNFGFTSQVAVGGLPYDFILTDNMEIPLLPGDSLDILSNIANQRLAGCVLWRERALEEGERT